MKKYLLILSTSLIFSILSCKKKDDTSPTNDATSTKGSISLNYNGQAWFTNEYILAGTVNNINLYTIPYVPLTIVGNDTLSSSSLSISWAKVLSVGDTCILAIDLEDSTKNIGKGTYVFNAKNNRALIGSTTNNDSLISSTGSINITSLDLTTDMYAMTTGKISGIFTFENKYMDKKTKSVKTFTVSDGIISNGHIGY